MRLGNILLGACCLAANALAQTQWPLHDNGLNNVVEWDHYSLLVNGKRIFMWSGEIHYWRMPVPELWIDILQKIKSAGFNTISIYGHWGWHSPADGTLDFETGSHDFTNILDIAKDIGLYVVFRPGPYVNAETNGGGLPGWTTTGDYGELRNNDTRYTEAWRPYMKQISEIARPYLVTNGGPIILYQLENEYGEQWLDVEERIPNYAAIEYMELLEAAVREAGIDVPTLHNNPNLGTKSWSTDYDINNVGGDVDVYSADSYPSCWSCNLEECTATNGFPPEFTTFDYYSKCHPSDLPHKFRINGQSQAHFQETAPTQPSILAEFQGGSYNPWDGPAGGCVNNTGPKWVNIFYRNNLSNKVTGINLYMLFGGTNWGGLPIPIVGTSYDYSAPISESRVIGDKYMETKLLGLFFRAAKDLEKIEKVGNGTTNYTGNAAVFAQELVNVDNGARFYVVKHTNTTLTSYEEFSLNVNTSIGAMTVPKYAPKPVIDGRQAKVLVSDFNAGDAKVIYSTTEVLAVSIVDENPIIAFWAPTSEAGEIYLADVQGGKIASAPEGSDVKLHREQHGTIISFSDARNQTVITFEHGPTVVIMDRPAAYRTWQPMLSNDPHDPLDQNVLVTGPHLIRSAKLANGEMVLTGDVDHETPIEVFLPNGCTSMTFNGKNIQASRTSYGSLIGTVGFDQSIQETIASSLPALDNWKVADGLPERDFHYNDSGPGWVNANKTETANPVDPETLPVLYADEYGFHAQNILWRGYFTGSATGAYLSVIGGTSSGWSAFLNGAFLGSTFGNVSVSTSNATLSFPDGAVQDDQNVLLVIQDNMGHDQREDATQPRGIINATLLGDARFTEWKVAGKAGGERNIDPLRGAYNEGGLHAERLGWHLPGFDDTDWATGDPSSGASEPGVKFYRTVVPLDIPSGYDVSLAFELHTPHPKAKLRAQLYVNGYMFGKFVPYVGNQVEFPVFPGILDYAGDNTIGLSVWNQAEEGEEEGSVRVGMKVLGVYASSLSTRDLSEETGYLRGGWGEERLGYA